MTYWIKLNFSICMVVLCVSFIEMEHKTMQALKEESQSPWAVKPASGESP